MLEFNGNKVNGGIFTNSDVTDIKSIIIKVDYFPKVFFFPASEHSSSPFKQFSFRRITANFIAYARLAIS